MTKVKYSIIIPSFNSAHTLKALLDSIEKFKDNEFEVILVDDGSTDNTRQIIKDYKLRYFKIKNSGPARARHLGTKKAKGDVLIFFDADVVLFPNTLKIIKKAFKNIKIKAITGIWDKKQKTKSFFPRYKALRDWCYWLKEDYGKFSYLFSTRVAAVRKEAYWQTGGFIREEKGNNALEDINFSFRLSEKCKIVFLPSFKVKHEFDNCFKILQKYYFRSWKWVKLFLYHHRLNRTVVTPSEALAGFFVVSAIIFLILGFKYYAFLLVSLCLFSMYLYLQRQFLSFVLKEEGIIFTLKSIAVSFVIYPVIYFAVFNSFLYSLFESLKNKFIKL